MKRITDTCSRSVICRKQGMVHPVFVATLTFRWLVPVTLLTLIAGCGPARYLERDIRSSAAVRNHHSGFVLYDPAKNKVLAEVNGDRYFTPASNTKILTLYAGLTLLGDSIPALRYRISGDSLIFTGTGDPSFLNPDTHTTGKVSTLLGSFPGKLFLAPSVYQTEHFGPGWAWDDFDAYYQPERSFMPVYGNTIRVSGRRVMPKLFSDSIRWMAKSPFARDAATNRFRLDPADPSAKTIPFRTSPALCARLLSDTLNRPVELLKDPFRGPFHVMKSVPADSLYKTMMQVSDNFLAEQILLMASMTLSDTLDVQPAIRHLLRNDLSKLPQRPRWVDGSGLSRYNQITPAAIVGLWELLYDKVPRGRLFALLAASGRNGTLEKGFGGRAPFIFGKTGTLSNNYCLSGFLITRRGRLLIFSSMNANFTVPVRNIRAELEKTLYRIHEKF